MNLNFVTVAHASGLDTHALPTHRNVAANKSPVGSVRGCVMRISMRRFSTVFEARRFLTVSSSRLNSARDETALDKFSECVSSVRTVSISWSRCSMIAVKLFFLSSVAVETSLVSNSLQSLAVATGLCYFSSDSRSEVLVNCGVARKPEVSRSRFLRARLQQTPRFTRNTRTPTHLNLKNILRNSSRNITHTSRNRPP